MHFTPACSGFVCNHSAPVVCKALSALLCADSSLMLSAAFPAAADYQARLNAGISAAISRAKEYDSDTREGLRQELVQSAELLDQASRLAMAAMLQVCGPR
jgi:hypothetical protein